MKLNLSTSLDKNNNLLLRCNDKSLHVLYHIISQYDEINDTWYSDLINKKEIAKELGMSLPNIDKKIAQLKDNGIIISKLGSERGKYELNKELFELGY